jgi:hypothetical protein
VEAEVLKCLAKLYALGQARGQKAGAICGAFAVTQTMM